ncbi:MAG: hypothetical protein IH865_04035 [Chloroflexi bacterium]|nr:hypothetical protein [Chloroflexota bacterium]
MGAVIVSAAASRRVYNELKRTGFLLLTDNVLPSVVSLVVGEAVRGSWWAHPRVHNIYDVAQPLGEHADVIVAKLVSGKNTYVHRILWPALIAVSSAREPWQLKGLSRMAHRLLAAVDEQSELRTDSIPWSGGARKDSPGEATRLLERKLLVHTEEVHTETGAHAKRLECWERWGKRVGLETNRMPAEQAKRELEAVLAELNERFEGNGKLPWH